MFLRSSARNALSSLGISFCGEVVASFWVIIYRTMSILRTCMVLFGCVVSLEFDRTPHICLHRGLKTSTLNSFEDPIDGDSRESVRSPEVCWIEARVDRARNYENPRVNSRGVWECEGGQGEIVGAQREKVNRQMEPLVGHTFTGCPPVCPSLPRHSRGMRALPGAPGSMQFRKRGWKCDALR